MLGVRSCLSLAVWTLCIAAISSALADMPSAIFVMKPDGTQVRRLAEVGDGSQVGAPRWSHDSAWLAFDAHAAGSKTDRVFLVKVDGSGQRSLGLGSSPDWSPDDKQLVFSVADESSGAELWVQNADGRGRLSLAQPGNAACWSPVGGAIAALNGDSLATLDLIDGTLKKLDLAAGVLPGFAWSPDGNVLAFVRQAESTKQLCVFEVANPSSERELLTGDMDGHVTWSPDGKRLAISIAGKIHLQYADGGDKPTLIPEQRGVNTAPTWSTSGDEIAFVSTRTSPALMPVVRARRSLKLEEVRRHTRGAVVYGLDLTLDGRKALLAGKRDLDVWDFYTDESKLLPLRGEWIAMSPDGHTVAQCGPIVKVAIGDLETGKRVRDLHVGTMCTNVRFSPDGKRVVTGTIDKQAIVYDVASGKRVSTFNDHQAPITRVMFLPGNQEAVSNGQDKHTRIWNAETAEERLAIAHPDVPWALAVSPDGRFVATGTGGSTHDNPILHKMDPCKDHVIRLWDTVSGQLVREMKGHSDVVYTMVFSPDGRTLVSGSWDATIRLWDVASGDELANVAGQGTIYALAITPDGTHIVAGGGENRSVGQPLRRYSDEQVRVYRIVEQ